MIYEEERYCSDFFGRNGTFEEPQETGWSAVEEGPEKQPTTTRRRGRRNTQKPDKMKEMSTVITSLR